MAILLSHQTFRLTLQQTGTVVALSLGLLTLPLAPLHTRISGAALVLFIAVAFGTRNIMAIGSAIAALNLTGRFLFPGSSWHDQHWVQWSSISSLLTGHNIFDTSPLYNFSLSSYMPAGDLFGGFFIALGIQKYWLVWHVLVVGLVALPLVLSPSFTTLLMFIAFSSIYPYVDYTTGGGTLEIAYALNIGAIALFRSERLLTASLVLFAYSAMFRQPAVVIIPFLILILWKDRDHRRLAIFGILLFLFGGIYILANPFGAYHYLFQVWEGYHQELFNVAPGLVGNYSISSIFHALGVPDTVNWYQWKTLYSASTVIGLASLFAIAWFRRSREGILFLGVLACAAVYVLARGYAQFEYTSTAFFPLVAFIYLPNEWRPVYGRRFSQALAMVVLWIGVAPAVFYAGALTNRMLNQLRPPEVIRPAATLEVLSSFLRVPLPPLNGLDGNSHEFPLSSAVELQLATPVYISGIRLSCSKIPIQNLRGVFMPYPLDIQMRGAITEGVIETSEDGPEYSVLKSFYNSATYCVWPVTIPLPATPRPFSALRLRAVKLYLDQKNWVLGNVELLKRP